MAQPLSLAGILLPAETGIVYRPIAGHPQIDDCSPAHSISPVSWEWKSQHIRSGLRFSSAANSNSALAKDSMYRARPLSLRRSCPRQLSTEVPDISPLLVFRASRLHLKTYQRLLLPEVLKDGIQTGEKSGDDRGFHYWWCRFSLHASNIEDGLRSYGAIHDANGMSTTCTKQGDSVNHLLCRTP